jgi:hypothetical protein
MTSSYSRFTVLTNIILTVPLCILASSSPQTHFLVICEYPSFLSYLFTFFLFLGGTCVFDLFCNFSFEKCSIGKAAMYGTGPRTTQTEFTKGLVLFLF